MAIEIKFKSVEEAVKLLGKEEAFNCLVVGYKQKIYRKEQNSKNQALLEAAKKDDRFRTMVLGEKKKSA